MDEVLTLTTIDPELSFGADSIGRKKKFLVGQDKEVILFSENMWELGVKAYDMCIGKYEEMSIPCTLEDHNKNLQECKMLLDSIVEHMREYANKGFFRHPKKGTYPVEETSKWVEHNYHDKLEMAQSYFDCMTELSGEDSYALGKNLYFYGVMQHLDQYILLDMPYSDESQYLFSSTKDLIHHLDKRTAIEKAVSKRAKSAVNVRHGKTYAAKEQLREWHKNNRHEFLKPDGSMHQSDAAEHICYVLKLTTLKAKKVAEYMGEFERDFKEQ